LSTGDSGKVHHSREPSDEEEHMCANCGCGIPEDNHGDDRNINWSAIVASAEANDIRPAEAVQNMQKMAEQQG
jgi:transcription initiation factor TFIIIB Brf1 subunit/transcription initiation factor TFIIB